MLTTPMAIITEVMLRPSSAAMPMAASRLGMASMMSTVRMTTLSTQPPKAPETSPSRMPNEAPIVTDTMPMSSEYRAP